MNNKLTIGGVVLLHAVAILLLTTVGGCRTSGNMDRNNNTSAFSGFPHETNASGYDASYAPAKRQRTAPAAAPVQAEPVQAEPVAPAATPVEATAERPVTPAPVAQPKTTGSGRTHVVKANESLWVIAKREGVSTTALAEANGLKKNATLREGQKLIIPAGTGAAVASSGSSSSSKSASTSSGDTYVVKKGDVLSIVARKLGTTSAALRAENNIKGDAIREGQKLRIPAGGKKPAATASSAPAAASAPARGASAPAAAPVSAPSTSGLKELTPMGGAPAPAAAPVAAPAAAPVAAPASAPEAVDVAK